MLYILLTNSLFVFVIELASVPNMYISLPSALRPLLISTLFAVFTPALSVEYEVSAFYDPNCGTNSDVGHLAGSWDGIQLHSSGVTSTPHGSCLKFDKALPEGCSVFLHGGSHIRQFNGHIADNSRATDLTFESMLIMCGVSLGVFD
ncbi:hypothetical protein DFJ43DRAFT_1075601 [Lentinula guzmanii]|uniref:Uncharacterized protein n=1 Tax=Lentinula guzmanii TaxID=2804957 RepID=A0AA38JGE5_9AGAR|nr:hypothetical protein DFJ43DRAFT_1075601 [Lentinula guzmanii]